MTHPNTTAQHPQQHAEPAPACRTATPGASRPSARRPALPSIRHLAGVVLAVALGTFAAAPANAALGLTTIAATAQDGPVTVFYPAAGDDQLVQRGRFQLGLAPDAAPVAGNGRLVVVSHGSGGAPWVHTDLARTLVQAGFVVAMPEHRGDNSRDDAHPGPDSWKQRPAEVSRAIDAVGRDTRFAANLQLDKVGVYGMSAGGHTALSLAGGRWSPAGFKRHCEAHITDDFQACVGLATSLKGNWLDTVKTAVALAIIRWRFDDDTPQSNTDPRVAAVVAAVPFAADFDVVSLVHPNVPLALLTARHDAWLTPTFHADAVLAACQTCDHLVDLPDGGHGAYLSPLPPGLDGLVGRLLNDPAGYDRAAQVDVNAGVTSWFIRQLKSGQPVAPDSEAPAIARVDALMR
jgi:predicted dienelactone hydrolase